MSTPPSVSPPLTTRGAESLLVRLTYNPGAGPSLATCPGARTQRTLQEPLVRSPPPPPRPGDARLNQRSAPPLPCLELSAEPRGSGWRPGEGRACAAAVTARSLGRPLKAKGGGAWAVAVTTLPASPGETMNPVRDLPDAKSKGD
ncbi:WAS protein family homolog 6-like [Panthera uncia]|uniref:WAS protein family homolog 6-like n=1 Tax=Panthera uncia TaxID=29064 RepID=UPI0020FFC318|nr:WAS protein family homolog 6-like [Panthera uncia]